MKNLFSIVLIFATHLLFSQNKEVRKMRMIENENGKKVEVEAENGKVTNIKVDDKVLPKEQYGSYKNLIDRLQNDANMDKKMDRPQKENENVIVENIVSEQIISTKKEGDNTILTLSNGDNQPINLTITKDGKILFDGNTLTDGSKIVLKSNKMLEKTKEVGVDKEVKKPNKMEERQIRKIITLKDDKEIANIDTNGDEEWLDDALLADKLITKKGNYSFEMTDKTLKINNVKQSDAIFSKYKKLYESHGMKFSEKTNITISKSSN
jgi:hypothetical protein